MNRKIELKTFDDIIQNMKKQGKSVSIIDPELVKVFPITLDDFINIDLEKENVPVTGTKDQ